MPQSFLVCRPTFLRRGLIFFTRYSLVKSDIKWYNDKKLSGVCFLIIAIDIDDTLTDSFGYFMPKVAEFFGADLKDLQRRGISYSNLPEEWKGKELEFCRKYYDDTVIDTPFKPNAVSVVNALKESGDVIYIVTARTKDFYTDPVKTTSEELSKNGILYDDLVCTFDKASFCKEKKVELFIDDSVSNCQKVGAVGIKTLLFTSPANESVSVDLERVGDWKRVYDKVSWIKRGYPDRIEAEKLLEEAERLNPGKWGDHSRIVAKCAEKIALRCGMDAERAFVSGLLHDIGRRFGVKHLGHVYDGYSYMKKLGYEKVAAVCLSHSFPTKNIGVYLGNFDISEKEQKEIEAALKIANYDDYDRLIQLCDAIGSADGVVDMEERMADVKKRYGKYSEEQRERNLSIKQLFETKMNESVYSVCSGL